MKLLEEIPSFPAAHRETLESDYGIASAEAFCVHAVKDLDGLAAALDVSEDEVQRLVHLVEGYLSPDYVARARQPVVRRARGVIVDLPLNRTPPGSTD